MQAALEAAREIGNDSSRARALSAAAAICEPRELVEVANALLALVNQDETLRAIESLAPQWFLFCKFRNSSPFSELSQWLEHYSRGARPRLIGALNRLVNVIENIGGRQALEEIASAITDVGKWWH